MGKVLLFLIAAVIGWFMFKGIFRKPPADRGPSKANLPERMVACDVCGVHMPESESMQVDGRRSCRVPAQCAHRAAA